MLKILLVDENEFFRDLMTIRFELEFKTQIDSVSSEIKAIERLREDQSYDLIIADCSEGNETNSPLILYVSDNLPETSVALTTPGFDLKRIELHKYLGVFNKLNLDSLVDAVSSKLLH